MKDNISSMLFIGLVVIFFSLVYDNPPVSATMSFNNCIGNVAGSFCFASQTVSLNVKFSNDDTKTKSIEYEVIGPFVESMVYPFEIPVGGSEEKIELELDKNVSDGPQEIEGFVKIDGKRYKQNSVNIEIKAPKISIPTATCEGCKEVLILFPPSFKRSETAYYTLNVQNNDKNLKEFKIEVLVVDHLRMFNESENFQETTPPREGIKKYFIELSSPSGENFGVNFKLENTVPEDGRANINFKLFAKIPDKEGKEDWLSVYEIDSTSSKWDKLRYNYPSTGF